MITDAKGNGINPATLEGQALAQAVFNKLQFDASGNLKVSSTGGSSGGDVNIADLYIAMKMMVNLMERNITIDPSTGKLRVLLATDSAIGTVTTVSTVSSVTAMTTLNQLAGFDAKQSLLYAQERSTWASVIRNRIV